ncbi:MAG: choice-of-anchor L domain-containing protein [Lewinellaceae bacterium]|nr:choice-of-anchor L domain-containing protein [Lewinellaceae bacterium]
MKNFLYTLSILFFSFTLSAQSGLFIDTSYTAEQMIMDFFDNSCVTPSNITFNGAPVMMGYFEAANTDLGVNAGIVISSGDVTQIAQPASQFANTFNGSPGDSVLQSLIGFPSYPSYDASVLEFDITVSDDGDLEFQYVFGSEEYPEFVGSSFNDVFGFFIDNDGTMENIALIPGSSTPVAINNVNAGLNNTYFVDNQLGEHIVYDGLTTVLPATFASSNGQTYHVKIGVTDIGDGIFDSGVFISTLSLCGPGFVEPPAQFSAQLIDNTITLTNESRYATSWHWDFGDQTTSNERHPGPHTYADPGTYEVTLITQNYCCTDTFSMTVEVGVSGTNELAMEGIDVFPNPVQDELNIQSDGALFAFEIRDISGRLIARGQEQSNLTLQTGNWKRGLYLLTLRTEKGVYTKKLSLH